jgi:hypothetical protein
MKILYLLSNHVVISTDKDYELGFTNGFLQTPSGISNIISDAHYGIQEVSSIPFNYEDGAFSYSNSQWQIADNDTYEYAKAKKSKLIRDTRNTLLQQSDWSQCTDTPDEIKIKWGTYRQLLRNITLQEKFPWDVSFPQKPV